MSVTTVVIVAVLWAASVWVSYSRGCGRAKEPKRDPSLDKDLVRVYFHLLKLVRKVDDRAKPDVQAIVDILKPHI